MESQEMHHTGQQLTWDVNLMEVFSILRPLPGMRALDHGLPQGIKKGCFWTLMRFTFLLATSLR